MKHKVSEIEGALLDAAVAKAEGFASFWIDPGDESRGESCVLGPSRAEDSRFDWMPSSCWGQGGPIIEREHIAVWWTGRAWAATEFKSVTGYDGYGYIDVAEDERQGPTPLVAAMRAYVASKFGEEVELPDDA